MADSYRPGRDRDSSPPPIPGPAREAMYHFKGNENAGAPARPASRHFRSRRDDHRRRPRPFSERPLLTQELGTSESQAFRDPHAKDKFRNPADLTDSEEDEMIESDEEDNTAPPAKIVRVETVDSPAAANAPKWSNPDPYTALPPPTEMTGKRLDVVKLIRKAKICDDKAKEEQELARNEDFIAFDADPEDDFFADIPTGPKADNLGKRRRDQEDARPRPPGGYRARNDDTVLQEWKPLEQDLSTPWHLPCRPGDTTSMALHKEIIDFYEWVKPRDYDVTVRADVLARLSLTFNRIEPGEIRAFGSYASGLYLPTGDMDLVFLQRGIRPGVLGPQGLPAPPKRRVLEKFAKFLKDNGVARPGSIQLIPFAKVPIIKFVDGASGLKIDLSFNNDTGVVANETVHNWKSTYPAMPILVAIVKQFLMIRGFNDVSAGGLGGFSIICLVTSLIQHIPPMGTTTNLGELLVEFFNLYGNLIDREAVAIRLDPPGYIDKAAYKPHLFNNEKRGRLTIIDPNRPENNISGGTYLIEQIADAFSRAHEVLQHHLSAFSDDAVDRRSFSFLKDLVGGNFGSYKTQREALKDLYFGLTGTEANEPLVPRLARDEQVPSPKLLGPATTGSYSKQVNSRTAVQSTDERSNGKGRNNGGIQQINVAQSAVGRAQKGSGVKKNGNHQFRAAILKLARPDLANQIGNSIKFKAARILGGYRTGSELRSALKAAEAKQGKLADNTD